MLAVWLWVWYFRHVSECLCSEEQKSREPRWPDYPRCHRPLLNNPSDVLYGWCPKCRQTHKRMYARVEGWDQLELEQSLTSDLLLSSDMREDVRVYTPLHSHHQTHHITHLLFFSISIKDMLSVSDLAVRVYFDITDKVDKCQYSHHITCSSNSGHKHTTATTNTNTTTTTMATINNTKDPDASCNLSSQPSRL